jgi:outer membrane receptor protein involved in Fe transport
MLKMMTVRSTIAAILAALSMSAHALADTARAIKVPAGDLVAALESLAKQVDIELVYQAAQLRGIHTDGVNGIYEPKEAVSLLLKGTSLTIRTDEATGVILVTPRARDDDDATQSEKTNALTEIVVTGSHIHGAAPASPVITLDQKQILKSGYTAIGDVIRTIPQNYGGGSNPALMTNSAPNQLQQPSGGSAPNLLGLGPTSTLTLVNGRRLPEGNAGAVDVTPIPLEVIDRIEVVADGSSAVYGSDAVAGVVNIILKKDFEGATTSVSAGGTTEGGAFEKTVSQIIGKSWQGGGVIFDFNHAHQDDVQSDQRDFTATAPRPDTLLPEMNRNSFFASAHQDIGSGGAVFAEGYYSARQLRSQITSYVGATPYTTRADVEQYFATMGVDLSLSDSWHGTVFATGSRHSTSQSLAPIDFDYAYRGKSRTFEVDADGALLTLPTGVARLAVGGGTRRDEFFQQSAADGHRTVSYAFGELQVPLVTPAERPGLNRLDLSLSGRLEHYSDFGKSTVPRVGLVYTPVADIAIRGTWGRSFHAPLLDDTLTSEAVVMNRLADNESPTGQSLNLIRLLGNPDLQPQTARTFSGGIEWSPSSIRSLRVASNYFNIRYSRVIKNLGSYAVALVNPADAPLVTRNPSAALQQQVLQNAGSFTNYTTTPYDPSLIAALVDARPNNAAYQSAAGVNLSIEYSTEAGEGTITSFMNAMYLRLRQRLTDASPVQELTGTVFEPPHVRARWGATYALGPWSLTGALNFAGAEKNIYEPGTPQVASWTTLDGQLAYEGTSGVLNRFGASLSIQNILNRDPPFVLFESGYPGLNYDPTNASPLGRFISLKLTKTF